MKVVIKKTKFFKLYKADFSTNFESENKLHFSKITNWWDINGQMSTLHTFNTLRMKFIVDSLKIKNLNLENKKVLDVGCGGGILSESLRRLGANVTSIDPNKTSIEVAKAHLKVYQGEEYNFMNQINYNNCYLHELDKNNFDFIFCFEVIEHTNNQSELIKDISSRLNNKGIAFISTINNNLISSFLTITLAENLGIIPKGTHNKELYLQPDQLKLMLEKESLNIIDLKGVLYNPIIQSMHLSTITTINYILAAEKII